MKQRIGIFGGTFHPVHNGHLAMAEAACAQFQLDLLLFLPTGHTPHKTYAGADMTSHRCQMLALALEGHPSFALSLYEAEGKETNYTYLTLQHFRREYPQAELYFLLGADSLSYFSTWVHPELICKEATILVAVRDGWDEERIAGEIKTLTKQLGGTFLQVRMPKVPISSREIRSLTAEGKDISPFVPAAVAAYIKDRRLYDKGLQSAEEADFKAIQQRLKERLQPDRYTHTLGVMQTAGKLAAAHGYPMERARLAGLLHDCAKNISHEEKISLCREHNIEIKAVEYANPGLLHAKCGAIVAKEQYGVQDAAILHAIAVHTTGEAGMSLLDKIIYVADYIEPNRDEAPNLDYLRRLAMEDLDRTVLTILEATVSHVRQKNPDGMDETTLAAYAYYKGKEPTYE